MAGIIVRISWDIRKVGESEELGPFAFEIEAEKIRGLTRSAARFGSSAFRGAQEGFLTEALAFY
jgi:hypothetical protein